MTAEGFALSLICCLLSWAVARFIGARAERFGLIDLPSERSSHTRPTPRGGGLGIVIAMEVAALTCLAMSAITLRMWLVFGACGAIVGLIGFADDRWSLRASIRLAIHVAVAVVVAWFACELRASFGLASGVLSGVVFALMVVWCINSFNFMDGVDGIAGMQAIFMAASAALLNEGHGGPVVVTILLFCLAAASLGFLFLNFPPAKIFMGDAASGFLGFALSLFAVAPLSSASLPISVWVILGGLFICDAGITLLRRIARGERVFKPHRLHAYQVLSRRWESHLAVTLLYAAVNIIWLLPWAYFQANNPHSWWPIVAALGPISAALIVAGAGRSEALPMKTI